MKRQRLGQLGNTYREVSTNYSSVAGIMKFVTMRQCLSWDYTANFD